jgi:hypothetical protein
VRRLTIGNAVWSLLQFNDLFIRKDAAIVNNLHRVPLLTDLTGTDGGFGNLAAIDIDLN